MTAVPCVGHGQETEGTFLEILAMGGVGLSSGYAHRGQAEQGAGIRREPSKSGGELQGPQRGRDPNCL